MGYRQFVCAKIYGHHRVGLAAANIAKVTSDRDEFRSTRTLQILFNETLDGRAT
jgi:hypothetical protein